MAPAEARARARARARTRLFPLAIALALLPVAACGGDGRAQPPEETPATEADASRLIVVVVDFSGSQTRHATNDARGYLEQVVEGLGYGDRFVLLEMYRTGARDSVGRFVQDMPDAMRADAVTSYDQKQLDAAKRGVLNALPVFFDPRFVGTVRTTDILTTLHIAAEYLGDAGSREKQLIMLSDMLQSTSAYEFERAQRMPPDGWADAQASSGVLPSLDGACIVVIGADPTTPAGQSVRAFWNDYFEATGAELDARHYRLRPPVDEVGC